MIGATNMLFKQKKGVSEVIVDIGMYLGSLKNMEPVGVKYISPILSLQKKTKSISWIQISNELCN